LRKADAVYLDEIRNAGLYDAIWQAFAVLLPVRTVGVMGDYRTYDSVCALRAVTSVDGMTADIYPFDAAFLSRCATRIINEVAGIASASTASSTTIHVEAARARSSGSEQAVAVTAGAEHVATFEKTPLSQRQYCALCGGHLMTHHPPLGLTDVYAATIPTLDFQPGVHVNYEDKVLPMKDGLPKFRDFPADFGGSGTLIDE
jgi:hypothetical protein